MLALKSTSRCMQTFNLPHEFYCTGAKCHCTVYTLHLAQVGGVLPVPRRLCASLTLLPGATSTPLPDSAAQCPEIAGALDRKLVRVIHVAETVPKPPPWPAPEGDTDT